MGRFVEGTDRTQVCFLPECLDDWVDENNPVQVIEVFVEGLDLGALGFSGVRPAATGRPAYHPAILLKLYIYGYLNKVQSSRRLEREAGRNVELMWLLGRLVPDHKTIADFRKDNGAALRQVCVRFVALCRQMGGAGQGPRPAEQDGVVGAGLPDRQAASIARSPSESVQPCDAMVSPSAATGVFTRPRLIADFPIKPSYSREPSFRTFRYRPSSSLLLMTQLACSSLCE